jgi:hypothetical protein
VFARLAFGAERPSSSYLHILSMEHETARPVNGYAARRGHIEAETQGSDKAGPYGGSMDSTTLDRCRMTLGSDIKKLPTQ